MTTSHYLRRFIDPKHQYRRWIDERVWSLRVPEIVAYLEDRGWKELPPDRPGYRAFQEPGGAAVEGRPVCQFVPTSDQEDLPLRMFELITGVAELEQRPASAVLDDVFRLSQGGVNGFAPAASAG
jgi:hypothetical protein